MKKTFRLKGLDCANCAAKMERKVKAIKGVNGVNVNFLTTKMSLEAEEENMAEIIEQATKAIKKIDSAVEIKEI
ncbi:MAG: heavy metal-associated domain-containing protein [Anaerovoracaceae bacterium]